LSKGSTIGQVCRKIDFAEQTYYRWRRDYGSLNVDQAKLFKEVKKGNACSFSFWFGFLDHLAWALLSGSLDCFTGSILTIVGFMGVQLRRDMQ
jgi:hypothetical protein